MNDFPIPPAAETVSPSGDFTVPIRPPRKRRRPALSCTECRRRKVRCDQKIPCTQCTKSKHAECKFDPDATPKARESANPTTSKLLPNETFDSPMTRGTNSLNPQVAATLVSDIRYPTVNVSNEVAQLNDYPAPEQQVFPLSASRSNPQEQQNVQELKDRVRQLETMVSCIINPDQGSAESNSDATNVFPRLKGSTHKARFFTMSHWMNTKKEVCCMKDDT